MSGIYLDASALVKLVITEPESAALRHFLAGDRLRFSSRVGAVEVRRAMSRQQERDAAVQVDAIMQGVRIVELDALLARAAEAVGPAALRTLDAIHLASALALGDELDEFVTYDARLADAARDAGLSVIAPS